MTFHIIYTPNTPKYLKHFTKSLLEHSPYHFRLVSNGCSPKERAILKKTANQDKRLSYYCFPTNQMQIHGKVLTHLQAKCEEEYFCFMDSDIFATAALPNFEEIIKKKRLTGLFSGMPLWVKKTEYVFKLNFKGMLGTFNQMEDGICIGSTYFAIYKKEDLDQIIQHYGVCFDECGRLNLPIDIQKKLQKMNYYQTSFDTGKIINLFLNKHGFNLKNIKIPELCHIGGTSYEATNQSRRIGKKQKLIKFLLTTPLKPFLLKRLEIRKGKYFDNRFKRVSQEEYQINYNQRVLHRNYTRQHFLKLFLALAENQPIPMLPKFEEEEIRQNIEQAHKSYIEIFKKYYLQ